MEKRDTIFIGLILILIGAFIFIGKLSPGVHELGKSASVFSFGLLIVGLGVLLSGIITKHPRVVLGSLLTGIAALLIYQKAAGGVWTWQPWLLLPSFLGVGILIRDIQAGEPKRKAWKNASFLILMGIILFALFSVKGFLTFLIPALLVLIGFMMIFGRKKEA